MSKADQKKIAKRYWLSISANNNSEICVLKLSSGVNDLSEIRMDNERKAFVKTDGRSSAHESGKKFGARKRKHRCSITMLNMWGTVSVGQANRSWTSMPKGERKCETKRVERYFIWSTGVCVLWMQHRDSLPVHGVKCPCSINPY